MYYNLLIRYHEHQNSYIDICRCYRSIYEVDMAANIHLHERAVLLLLKVPAWFMTLLILHKMYVCPA